MLKLLFGDLLAFVVKKWLWLSFIFSFEIVEDLKKPNNLGSLFEMSLTFYLR